MICDVLEGVRVDRKFRGFRIPRFKKVISDLPSNPRLPDSEDHCASPLCIPGFANFVVFLPSRDVFRRLSSDVVFRFRDFPISGSGVLAF